MVINGLISSYNENVLELQNSIRAAARLSLRLNLISGFMAMIGLAAQVGQAWKAWPPEPGGRRRVACRLWRQSMVWTQRLKWTHQPTFQSPRIGGGPAGSRPGPQTRSPTR